MAPRLSTLTSRRVFGSVPIVRYFTGFLSSHPVPPGHWARVWMIESALGQTTPAGQRPIWPAGAGLPRGAWHAVTQQLASCAAAEAVDFALIRPASLAAALVARWPVAGVRGG